MRGLGKLAVGILQRTRTLTTRQAVALAVAVVLGTAIGVAALLDLQSLAVALLGAMGIIIFVALLQVRRRVALEAARVVERLEIAHRRVLAAVETERLAAADRHRALLAAIDRTQPEDP